jgi:uncharacterized protein (DUF2237 family)
MAVPGTHQNVLGTTLVPASLTTGFFRDGYARPSPQDLGEHIAAAQMTKEFLDFTAQRGNDLRTPRPELDFPGLKPGDRWALCASRWMEALHAGVAPPLILQATHKDMLKYAPLEVLQAHGK